MASVSELLYNTLDDLVEDDLKRFRRLLKDDKKIRAGKLENAGVTDIVDLMLECYGDDEAVKITLNILRKINQNQLAEDLQENSEGKNNTDHQCCVTFNFVVMVISRKF
uniref:Pyrin domain-containing protein n=1 Tax=Sinocyclocheilus rhinocerous TaxID=307959 RepID=A0A673FRJ7_9TELE